MSVLWYVYSEGEMIFDAFIVKASCLTQQSRLQDLIVSPGSSGPPKGPVIVADVSSESLSLFR